MVQKLSPVLAVAAMAVTLAAATSDAQAAPVSFHDSFTSPRVLGWNSPGSNDAGKAWTGGGALRGSGTLLAKTNWANYEAALRAQAGGGVVFRYRDGKNFYRLTVGGSGARLAQMVAGRPSTVAANRRKYPASNVIHVIASGRSASVAINGRQTFTITRGKLTGGRFGVYAPKPGRFDNVTITSNSSAFEMVVIPDTQNEVRYKPSYLNAQMSWIADHRGLENIGLVLQEGDVVQDLAIPTEWQRAASMYGLLRGELPLQVCAGNHDIFDELNDHVPYPIRSGPYGAFVRNIGARVDGRYGALNTYARYTVGGLKWLVLSLEFGAPDNVLAWARRVVKAHPGDHAILLTHDYLGARNEWRAPPDLDLPTTYNPNLNDGISMWTKLVARSRIQFTFNGHDLSGTAGRRVNRNPAGRVYQQFFNRQNEDAGGGYMRVLRFDPATKSVSVRTFSPVAGSLNDSANHFAFSGVNLR